MNFFYFFLICFSIFPLISGSYKKENELISKFGLDFMECLYYDPDSNIFTVNIFEVSQRFSKEEMPMFLSKLRQLEHYYMDICNMYDE